MNILRQLGFEVSKKWYQQQPENIVENGQFKKFWDFTIRLDIKIVGNDLHQEIIIDVAMPVDVNVRSKEQEKIIKYQRPK